MVLPLVIMAGMQVMQGLAAKSSAKSAQTAAKSNARVSNILRKAQNQIEAATGSLARYMQSRQNQELLRAGGKALDATTTNILRLQEAAVTGGLARRIQAAEEAGTLFASRAAAGLRGGTSEMLRATQELRVAQIEQQTVRQEEQMDFGLRQQREQQMDAMVLGLDLSPVIDSINLIDVEPQRVSVPSTADIAGRAGLQFAQAYLKFRGGKAGAGTPALGTYGTTDVSVAGQSGFRAGFGPGR